MILQANVNELIQNFQEFFYMLGPLLRLRRNILPDNQNLTPDPMNANTKHLLTFDFYLCFHPPGHSILVHISTRSYKRTVIPQVLYKLYAAQKTLKRADRSVLTRLVRCERVEACLLDHFLLWACLILTKT